MANDGISYWCGIVFDSFKDSVVRLDSPEQFSGNGFVVFSSGNTSLILTCAHVLPKSKIRGNVHVVVVGSIVSALFQTGVRFDARVAYVDEGRDLALLRAGVPCKTPMRFWEEGDVLTGVDVVLLSFFTNKHGQVLAEPGTFPGKILCEPVWNRKTESEEIRSDYTSKAGTSGAPVLLQRANRVIAVNSGAFGGKIKIGSSVRTIKAALREWLQVGNENLTIKQMLKRIAER